ncbi:MAG: M67 family metallopeptidase [Vicinamibacterales bacterium]
MTSIRIPAAVVGEMLAHARAEAPRECCGLLVGKASSIMRSVRARNLDAAATRYLIDPEDHFAAIRAARAQGLEVVGAYHSHPASTAMPSPTDVAEASSGSDFLYLIVSLVNDDVQAYRMADGEFVSIRHQEA